MKRHGNLYDKIVSHESLYAAYRDASAGKRATNACYQFERRLGAQIDDLHRSLYDGSYQPLPMNNFMVFEPKPRKISAPAFRDRVVQHAIYNQIRPIFDRTFIDQSFACRIGKGTHLASDYVQRALQRAPRDGYVLQMDIRRYYYSLDRWILRQLIERKIKDHRLVDLMMQFALTDDNRGVPIGSLLSQLAGLIYLNPLDHMVKRDLKVERYARYVDDFVLIGITCQQDHDYAARIQEFLHEKLRLSLSHTGIFPVARGINFVGFRTWASKRFIRKRALYTFRRAAKKGRVESVISSLGHASKTASRKHMTTYLKEYHNELYRQLPQSVR